MIPDLRTSLLDLLLEIRGTDIQLIVGGGFGLYLKLEYVQSSGLRTLFREYPSPRSTNDLDLFLRPELLADSEKLKPLADAMVRLKYEVIPGAEKYQFAKPGSGRSGAGSVKIDILTGPENRFRETCVRTDGRRARPNPSIGLHAHPVNEALTLEEGLLSLRLAGTTTSRVDFEADVFLPQPYTYLMMKLFAFRDRLEDPRKDYARYHALDLYSILAMTTEDEWEYAKGLRDRYRTHVYVLEAGRLASLHFSGPSSIGTIRLKESPYYRPEFQIDEFLSALRELFPPE